MSTFPSHHPKDQSEEYRSSCDLRHYTNLVTIRKLFELERLRYLLLLLLAPLRLGGLWNSLVLDWIFGSPVSACP